MHKILNKMAAQIYPPLDSCLNAFKSRVLAAEMSETLKFKLLHKLR